MDMQMNSMGVETTMISRVGDDENGKNILSFLNDQELTTDLIQIT
ncbi:hypothetical protein ACM55I_13750 [Flavobacterium sp. GB2R13]